MTADAQIADTISRLRRDRMTQTQLAAAVKRAGIPGMHQVTISRIESGERPVRLAEGYAIAQALGVQVEDLFADIDSAELIAARLELREARDSLRAAQKRVADAELRIQSLGG